MWLIDSSIGRKVIMSVTGLFLVLFLIFHMSMNVTAIFSGETYNDICGFLGANWYALAGTMVLAAGVVLHIVFAFILSYRNYKARPIGYSTQKNQKEVELASQNMLVLGLIILLGLGLHLSHFWAKMQLPEILGTTPAYEGEFTNGAELIKITFSNLGICVGYIAWFFVIWFHLTHGIWSAFQSTGLDNKVWFPRLKMCANILSTIIFLGFTAVVVAGYLQSN
ncbi:MAG: succinate dehydrogenase/fumarate reductase cytochrome b subunit [Paludibacteraceae bacterium]|nr:succinate dehydrogenase/fumarate reductase cytochrome b subunit [Paludibacteraceae bacterium]